MRGSADVTRGSSEPGGLEYYFRSHERGLVLRLFEHLEKPLCCSELPHPDERSRTSDVGVIAREREPFGDSLVELEFCDVTFNAICGLPCTTEQLSVTVWPAFMPP